VRWHTCSHVSRKELLLTEPQANVRRLYVLKNTGLAAGAVSGKSPVWRIRSSPLTIGDVSLFFNRYPL
jgi:hypothetical protein